jgi:hypothetical protein
MLLFFWKKLPLPTGVATTPVVVDEAIIYYKERLEMKEGV